MMRITDQKLKEIKDIFYEVGNNYFFKGKIDLVYSNMINQWSSPWRFYHDLNHLHFLLTEIKKLLQDSYYYHSLILAAVYHDYYYNPKGDPNFEQNCLYQLRYDFEYFSDFYNSKIYKEIEGIVGHSIKPITQRQLLPLAKCNSLNQVFDHFDLLKLTSDIPEQIEITKNIIKEYQFLGWNEVVENRKQFILSLIDSDVIQIDRKEVHNRLLKVIEYFENYEPNIGVYLGSFNPLHLGHINIIEKGEEIFDMVIIGKGINNSKKHIKKYESGKSFKFRKIIEFKGLSTDFLTRLEKEYKNITLIRGLRNGEDLNMEINQLRYLNQLKPDLKTTFFICDHKYDYISSSGIRNLIDLESDLANEFLPK